MKSTMSLQIETEVLLRLVSQLEIRGGAQDLSSAITSAIELWLREQAKLRKGCDPANARGYQWKTLFLPEGTELHLWQHCKLSYKPVHQPNRRRQDHAEPAKAGTCPSVANSAIAWKM